MQRSSADGFSLIEALVALGLLAVILSFALPTFGDLLQRNRQDVAIQQLREVVNFARSTAITRNSAVSICNTVEGRCSGARHWTGSARIFLDEDRDGRQAEHETTVRESDFPTGFTWRWKSFRTQPHLTFLASGLTDAVNGSFILCQGTQPQARLALNKAGRIQQAPLRAEDQCI